MWLPWIFILSSLTFLMVAGIIISEVWTLIVYKQEREILEPQIPAGSIVDQIQNDCIRYPQITLDFRAYLVYLDKTLAWTHLSLLQELRSWSYWRTYVHNPSSN